VRSGVLWNWIHGEVDPETRQREGGIIKDPRGLYYWFGATDDEDLVLGCGAHGVPLWGNQALWVASSQAL
jgi:hypothetical protein